MRKIKTRSIFTVILAMLCAVAVAIGVTFALPKTDKIDASAASDINPTLTFITTKKHSLTGGYVNTTPASVAYGGFNGGNSNLYVATSLNPSAPYVHIYNDKSTLAFDMAFVEFSLSVVVPAESKVTAKYTVDVSLKKIADSTGASSLYSAELYHFGTGDPITGDGSNPVDVSTMSFYPSNSSPHTSTKVRLDGGSPTSVMTCKLLSGYGDKDSEHGGFTYYNTVTNNYGTKEEGCAEDHTAQYITSEIIYENTTNTSKTFKEYFGFMACTGIATGACHILEGFADISHDIQYEKVKTPSADVVSKTYAGGDPVNFTLKDYTAKTVLTKVVRKDIKGSDTTLYTKTTAGETGTNPISGTSTCTFTDVGKYTLTFKPESARWEDTLGSEERTLDLYVLPKFIKVPTVANNDTSGKTYDGTEQTFNVRGTGTGVLSAADWPTYIDIDTNKDGVLPDGVTDNSDGTLGVTDKGEYEVKFTLVDPDNTCWADKTASYSATAWVTSDWGGARAVSLKMKAAPLTVALDVDKKDGADWEWDNGDKATVTVEVSGFVLADHADDSHADKVVLNYYYIKDGGSDGDEVYISATKEEYDSTTKTIKATVDLDETISQGKYTFGVKPDAGTGAGDNYSVTGATNKFTVNSASLDPSKLLWTYTKGGKDSKATLAQNGKLTFETENGSALSFAPQIQLSVTGDGAYDYTGYVEINGSYSGDTAASQVKAGGYKTVVTLKIKDGDTDHVFANPDGASYVEIKDSGRTAVITMSWEIEPKEVDLSAVDFEYSADNGKTWEKYDPDNPPAKSGFNFKVRIANADMPEGVTAVAVDDPTALGKGPGDINFDFNFTLDGNHKAKDDKTVVGYTLKVTGTQIEANWVLTTLKDNDGKEIKSEKGIPFQIYVLDYAKDKPGYEYIKYEYYYDTGTTYGNKIEGGIDEIIKSTANGGLGAGENPVKVYVRAVLDGMTQTNGVDPYVLKFSGSQPEYKKFSVGDNKDIIDVSAGSVTSIVYGNGATVSDLYKLTVKDTGDTVDPDGYKVSLYTDTTLIEEDIVANKFDFATLDAGTYRLAFELVNGYEDSYVLTNSGLSLEVTPVELVVPTIKEGATFTFNGEEQNLLDSLVNFKAEYMEFASNSLHEGMRNAGSYNIIINIKEDLRGNYVFILPEDSKTGTKATVAYALTDGESENLSEISDGGAKASFKWVINKYVLDTTSNNAWNFSKDGASLKLPDWLKALTAGTEPTLTITTLYYDTEGNLLTDVEIKGGSKFLVAAYIDPSCADANNIEFKGQVVDKTMGYTTSPQTAYTVPKSGAAALMGDVKAFATKTWMGLPIWAWLLIGLAVLLLLIIIIAVCAKRRKTKEQREEAKARKEEERQRREDERRMQQERLQAERELAMAKQQAELEKIRMQSGMAGAGMASMAMQQQVPVQQQAMPAPAQQPVPMQQATPAPVQTQMPQSGSMGMTEMMAMMFAQFAGMKADNADKEIAALKSDKEITALKTELEIMKLKLEQIKESRTIGENARELTPEFLGAVIASAMRNNGVLPGSAAVAEIPQQTTESASVACDYPPDAVITTTTTVDTTQKSMRRERDGERDGTAEFSDLDGFYDAYKE